MIEQKICEFVRNADWNKKMRYALCLLIFNAEHYTLQNHKTKK